MKEEKVLIILKKFFLKNKKKEIVLEEFMKKKFKIEEIIQLNLSKKKVKKFYEKILNIFPEKEEELFEEISKGIAIIFTHPKALIYSGKIIGEKTIGGENKRETLRRKYGHPTNPMFNGFHRSRNKEEFFKGLKIIKS